MWKLMWQIGMKYCLARAMNKQKEENEDNKTDNDVFIICMLGACTAEELAGPESGVEDDAPVVIAISPADITSVNMNSRAAGDNSIFSVIDDVNVKVNYGGNTVTVYLVKNGDSFEVSGSVENGSAGVVSSKTADGKVYIHINAKQGNQAVRVEVIANYGRKITLSLWQSVKESLIQWPVDFDETSACLLYGASEQFIYTENPHEGAQGGNKGCYLAKVSLKRPYAMIKVNINTSGLDNEVTLTPRSVQLCNVPKTCTLASDNSITDFTSFDKEGQKYDFPSGSLLTGPSGNGETQVMSERLYQFENKQTVHAQNCTDAQMVMKKPKPRIVSKIRWRQVKKCMLHLPTIQTMRTWVADVHTSLLRRIMNINRAVHM